MSSQEIQKLKFEHEEEEQEQEQEEDDRENERQNAFDCSSNINLTNLTCLSHDSTIVLPERSLVHILNYSFEEIESNHKNASMTDSNKLQKKYERVPNFTI